jgi:hypothetical protein
MLENFDELVDRLVERPVIAVAVRRLEENQVGSGERFRIAQNRRPLRTQIAGKDDGAPHAILEENHRGRLSRQVNCMNMNAAGTTPIRDHIHSVPANWSSGRPVRRAMVAQTFGT